MSEREIYIGLGSDLGDRRWHLEAGLTALHHAGLPPGKRSSIWESDGVDTPAPARFLNMVVLVRSALSARDVLDRLQAIERRLGRVRREPNAPRTLDLDLLLSGQERIDEPGLRVPHPRMWQRRFVLEPLAEIAPDLLRPGDGRRVIELCRELERREGGGRIRRLDSLARRETLLL